MHGDFFVTGDIGRNIVERLHDVALEEEELRKALPDDLDQVIMNLTKDGLVRLLTDR